MRKVGMLARLLLGAGTMVSAVPGLLAESVMSGTVPVYLIWYGEWSARQQTISTNFLRKLSGSSWRRLQEEGHGGEREVRFDAALIVPA